MAFLENNERLQELFLFLGDHLRRLNRKTLVALGIFLLGPVLLFFVLRAVFFYFLFANYHGPAIIYQPVEKAPLSVIDQKVFKLDGTTYGGVVQVRNTNLDWGVAAAQYRVQFQTADGSVANQISSQTFILPASTKTIVFERFSSDQEIQDLDFQLLPVRFVHKPQLPAVSLDVQRIQIISGNGNFRIQGVVKNLSAFTISEIYLPALLYNSQNQIIGANLTTVNDVRAFESRSFQLVWPNVVVGVQRPEVDPEINIFKPGILVNEPGTSPFSDFSP